LQNKLQLSVRLSKDLYFDLQKHLIKKEIDEPFTRTIKKLIDNYLNRKIKITKKELVYETENIPKERMKKSYYISEEKRNTLANYMKKEYGLENLNALITALIKKYIS
jgi:NH3-dependent NAD+ synthetase